MLLMHEGRMTGKTTQAFSWVSHGVRVDGYPGWSRVLLIPTVQRFYYHRHNWWDRLEDYDHRVYELSDWITAVGTRVDTEVCIDDLDLAIRVVDLRHIAGKFVAATITAAPWEHVEFKERTDAAV